MAISIEIERKFLLKAMPVKDPDDIISIVQYYWKNEDNIWERSRTYHSDINGDSYIHTIKRTISRGISSEDEKDITKDEFDNFVSRCLSDPNSRVITKERYIYKDKKLKWEVDVFKNGYKLIIAEIEIPKKRFRLQIPGFIKEVMLMEVTHLKEFSSRALSVTLSDKNRFKKKK
jgi:CYTH domain-containing protein